MNAGGLCMRIIYIIYVDGNSCTVYATLLLGSTHSGLQQYKAYVIFCSYRLPTVCLQAVRIMRAFHSRKVIYFSRFNIERRYIFSK